MHIDDVVLGTIGTLQLIIDGGGLKRRPQMSGILGPHGNDARAVVVHIDRTKSGHLATAAVRNEATGEQVNVGTFTALRLPAWLHHDDFISRTFAAHIEVTSFRVRGMRSLRARWRFRPGASPSWKTKTEAT